MLDEIEKQILEITLRYVNDAASHKLDEALCASKIEEITTLIEEFATEIEEGEYELPPDDRRRGED